MAYIILEIIIKFYLIKTYHFCYENPKLALVPTLSGKLIVFELLFSVCNNVIPCCLIEARIRQVLSSKKMAPPLLNNDSFKEPELINYSHLNVIVPERIKRVHNTSTPFRLCSYCYMCVTLPRILIISF